MTPEQEATLRESGALRDCLIEEFENEGVVLGELMLYGDVGLTSRDVDYLKFMFKKSFEFVVSGGLRNHDLYDPADDPKMFGNPDVEPYEAKFEPNTLACLRDGTRVSILDRRWSPWSPDVPEQCSSWIYEIMIHGKKHDAWFYENDLGRIKEDPAYNAKTDIPKKPWRP